MRTERFEIAYSSKRLRRSVGATRKTECVEAIKNALVDVGWTVEESLEAYGEIIVWFPQNFVTSIPIPPIAEGDKKNVYASTFGTFGFLNEGIMEFERVCFYDPYRENPMPGARVTWVAKGLNVPDTMQGLLTAFENVFVSYGTVARTSSDPYTFRFTIPNAGTLWNDAHMYANPANATVVFHGYGIDYGGDMSDGAWKYGGYRLRSAANVRTGRCQLKIYEGNGGVYSWTGIHVVPGTDTGYFYDSTYFVIDTAGTFDIIANPHGFVLFSPGNVATLFGRWNMLFGNVNVPVPPNWPEVPGNHVYASTTFSTDDQKFRLSARPYSLVSLNGGPLQYGDFGLVGPNYEVDAPLQYRRGDKPLISNALVHMGTDRFDTLGSRIAGKLWDALLISKRCGFPDEIRFDNKLWAAVTSQRGVNGSECALYIAYADAGV